jgi:hypothetical protein
VTDLAKRLSKRLRTETNRTPRIQGESRLVYWQPNQWRDDKVCVGVVFEAPGIRQYLILSDDELQKFAGPCTPFTITNLSTALNALAQRLKDGDLSEYPGFEFGPVRPAAGRTLNEIMKYLWELGPGWATSKKKPPEIAGSIETEAADSRPATSKQPHKARS